MIPHGRIEAHLDRVRRAERVEVEGLREVLGDEARLDLPARLDDVHEDDLADEGRERFVEPEVVLHDSRVR